MQATYKQYFES